MDGRNGMVRLIIRADFVHATQNWPVGEEGPRCKKDVTFQLKTIIIDSGKREGTMPVICSYLVTGFF